MEKNEKDFESGVEFNQEKEPLGKNLRFYYNQDDGRVTTITLETKDGDVDLFPVPVKLPDREGVYNYTPTLIHRFAGIKSAQQDERGNYFYPGYTGVMDSLYYTLESDGYDRSCLDFLSQHLPEEEFLRYLIEQTAVKISLKKSLNSDILTPSRYEEEKKKLLFQWPDYYSSVDGFRPKDLPIASQYEAIYLINKAIEIYKNQNRYDISDLHFSLEQIEKIDNLENKSYEELETSQGDGDLISTEVKLAIELTEYHNLSDADSKSVADYIRNTEGYLLFMQNVDKVFDRYDY